MDSQTAFSPKGLLFGLVLPGAGHMATGQMSRGVFVLVGVLGLFFGGIFVGGIDVVDSQEDRIWFIGEALVGPIAFGVDAAHQKLFKAYDPELLNKVVNTQELDRLPRRSANPNEMRVERTLRLSSGPVTVPVFEPAAAGKGPPNKKSLAKINELGTLFCTIAGMMNLIAIIDAAFPSPRTAPGTAKAGGAA